MTEIGARAFKECSQLTDITYPKNITKISDWAFYGTGLINIIIPNTVTYIGISTFCDCASSEYINIPNSIQFMGERAFGHATQGEIYIDCDIPSVASDWTESAFAWSHISKITIGRNVKFIGDYAFVECNQVTTIVYEDGNKLEHIGKGGFGGCPLVEEMPIPESVEFIGEYAFSLCSNLKTFKMVGSGNGNYIVRGNGALYDDTNLALVRYPPKNEAETYAIEMFRDSIAPVAFRDCNNLKTIQLPTRYLNNKMRFGAASFCDCKNLKTVENFSLTGITVLNGLFRGCEKLTSIELPTTIEEIRYAAFEGCTSLTGDLIIPDNIKTIGESAFKGCTGFKGKLIIPNSVETIGDRAFKGCTGVLEGGELYLGTGLRQIGGGAFDAGSDDYASIPSSFSKIYCNATVPPIIDYNYSSELGCEQLIVPKGYLEIYQNSNWASVSNYITEEN